MIIVEPKGHMPMYEQIYQTVKEQIERGHYSAGDRLPSIRGLAEELGVSKITVEQAYSQLATEGYIKAHYKAPYEVMHIPMAMKGNDFAMSRPLVVPEEVASSIRFNFATGAMDPECFDMKRWKRYIGYVLRESQRLMAYGHVQGEPELRFHVAQYLQSARGVMARQDSVIVANGTHSALRTVASLLRQKGKTSVGVSPYSADFVRHTFEEFGFSVVYLDGANYKSLCHSHVDILYCTPSHDSREGRIMTIQERNDLLRWAYEGDAYIIEDDYDSELRYYGKPVMSLQGMDQQERVIYMGAPSKVLPPSIRISYFVLPPHLYTLYEQHLSWYPQGASVMEQLVWARYMESGEWQKQIRRLRKHYLDKSKYFVALLEQYLGDAYEVNPPEGGIYVWVRRSRGEAFRYEEAAHRAGCDVKVWSVGDDVEFLLSFSAIPTRGLEEAVTTLAKAWEGL